MLEQSGGFLVYVHTSYRSVDAPKHRRHRGVAFIATHSPSTGARSVPGTLGPFLRGRPIIGVAGIDAMLPYPLPHYVDPYNIAAVYRGKPGSNESRLRDRRMYRPTHDPRCGSCRMSLLRVQYEQARFTAVNRAAVCTC